MRLNNTCFIVGAGASFDCFGDGRLGVPLTRDLLTPRNKLDLQPKFITSIKSRIQQIDNLEGFPFRGNADEAIGHGLEKTIAFLNAQLATNDVAIRKACSELQMDITRAVRNAITNSQLVQYMGSGDSNVLIDNSKYNPPRNYGWLVALSSVSSDVSVITLNYDNILDTTYKLARRTKDWPDPQQYLGWIDLLRAYSVPEGEKAEDWKLKGASASYSLPDHGLYVKLHGTLFTYSCLNASCQQRGIPVLHKEFKEDLPDHIEMGWGNDPQHHCSECGERLSDLIIPPSENKGSEEGPFYKILYEAAVENIRRCDQIFVIGYSFPEYDRDVIDIILEGCARSGKGFAKDFYIIAPDATVIGNRMMESIERINPKATVLGDNVRVKDITFSDFVKVANLTMG